MLDTRWHLLILIVKEFMNKFDWFDRLTIYLGLPAILVRVFRLRQDFGGQAA
jgi:hypothetical protein